MIQKRIIICLCSLFIFLNLRSADNYNYSDSLLSIVKDSGRQSKERLNAFKYYVLNSLYSRTGASYSDLSDYLNMSIEFEDSIRISHAYQCLFFYYRKKEIRDSADYYNERLFSTADAYGSEYYMISALNNSALLKMDLGEFEEARSKLKEGLELAIDSNEIVMETRCRINLGELYQKEGDYLTAIEQFNKALDLAINHDVVGYMASIYFSLGGLSELIFDVGKARNYYDLALEWSLKRNNRNTERNTLKKYFSLLVKEKDTNSLNQLLKVYARSVEVSNIPIEKAIYQRYLSSYFLIINNPDSAYKYAKKSLEYFRNKPLLIESAESHLQMAKVYFSQQKFKLALSTALEISYSNDQQFNYKLFDLLYQIYKKLGNDEKALYYLEKKEILNNSLKDNKNLSQMVKSQLSNEFRRQQLADSLKIASEKELADLKYKEDIERQKMYTWSVVIISFLLIFIAIGAFYGYKQTRRYASQLEQQKVALEESDQQKSVLLKEIHHRVKNNLQIICSLLEIQSMNSDDKQVSELLNEGQNRVKSMALIHQNLYQFEDMSSIEFDKYAKNLVNHLIASYSRQEIDLQLNLIPLKLDIDTAIPLGLILNELITNAFKHAFNFSEKSMLKVELKSPKENEFVMKVIDNGGGIKDGAEISKMYSTGMQLIQGLTKQLFGTITYKYDNGSHFLLTFKSSELRKEIA